VFEAAGADSKNNRYWRDEEEPGQSERWLSRDDLENRLTDLGLLER
jgi:hypothetical protein